MKIPCAISVQIRTALKRLGRTEDVRIAPDGKRIAIAGFNASRILLLEADFSASGQQRKITLTDCAELSHPSLDYPHGLSFVKNTLLAVANREGGASLLQLPETGLPDAAQETPSLNIIPSETWLHSPGSVCNYQDENGLFHVLFCNNYADNISRHILDLQHSGQVIKNELMIARGLQLPDGVSVSHDTHWIAISNHEEKAVRIYRNSPDINRSSPPVGALRGAGFPHGVLFTPDDKFVIAADAGAPYLRIYARRGKDWRGEHDPVLSLRVMSDEMFKRGNENPQEGGMKGIDWVPETLILAASCDEDPLSFFDMEKVLKDIRVSNKGQITGLPKPSQRCPCGSKKKFRSCCNARSAMKSADSGQGADFMLQHAVAKLNQGHLPKVEELCNTVLRRDPQHPRASHLLGLAHHAQGRHREAANLFRTVGERTAWRDMMLRYHYGEALAAIAAGHGAFASAQLRLGYRGWQESLSRECACEPLVSIVAILEGPVNELTPPLISVFAQNYSKIELVVINTVAGEPIPSELSELLDQSPFPVLLQHSPGLARSFALNEAVNLAKGEFINAIGTGDKFKADRIRSLVENIVAPGLRWGFSGCSLVCAGEDTPSTVRQFMNIYRESSDWLHTADTVGCTLLGIASPVLSTGNLFFSRSLYDDLEGFKPFEFGIDVDFALRALWQTEPGLVVGNLLCCDMNQRYAAGRFSNQAQRELGEILESYFERAKGERPPNQFAPARSGWGYNHIACALHGKQTRIPLATLLRLDEELSRIESSYGNIHPATDSADLNLVGMFRGNLGLGESVRQTATACMVAGLEVNLHEAGIALDTRQSNRSFDHLLSENLSSRNTLFYLNPGQLESTWYRLQQQGRLRGQRLIGMWYWELDQLPRHWRQSIDLLDEIWVASGFVQQTIQQVTDKPVVRVPHPIEIECSRSYQRSEFSLPEKSFLFLFNFDFNSYIQRKNPWAVLRAFRLAFPDNNKEVGLVIKSTGASRFEREFELLRKEVNADPRVHLIDQLLPRDTMYGLQRVCDAYVSLHRAEGFGLGMAESMALGKPVIGTAYSGNLDFMNHENSCLVDYHMIPVKPGQYQGLEPGWMWAEADVEMAAAYMQRLVEEPEFRNKIAVQAAADISANHSFAVVGKAIREQLASSIED